MQWGCKSTDGREKIMLERLKSRRTSRYLVITVVFLLVVTVSLGYLLVSQTKRSIVALMQTRMLDISNTAAAMIDGDALKSVTSADEGTEKYESIMRTLRYFQDSIDLKYIYCVRDMGDGTFTFGLDPTVEDPGEFGSPIVYTDALNKASKGHAAADSVQYQDAWGTFYSAYSPVFDSEGKVAGIIAVDFSAEWYNQQLAGLTGTTIIVAVLSLLIGGGIVTAIATKRQKQIGSIQGQLNNMANTLMHEMGNDPSEEEGSPASPSSGNADSMDSLEEQIQTMQTELQTQIAQVHGHAYQDGLTGVKSKQAFINAEAALDQKLAEGTISELALVVCDVNGLKTINDTKGHKAGDEYIRQACKMVCDIFTHSPVYRVGGDEFAVILTDRDYQNREVLMYRLHNRSMAHIATEGAVVSGGLAEYDSNSDQSIREVFERADATMYKEKMLLKSLGAATREGEPEQATWNAYSEGMPASNVRRRVLIVDDIESNREILGDLLMEDYDVLYAADGVEAMEVLQGHKDEVDLVLLDLFMPNMNGREVLMQMQVNEDLASIPVIVLTVDEDAQIDCLKYGAMDFISKPYPDIEIVKARIAKCIELSENRDLIRQTQRDKLTGLFNVDYFMRYVDRFDHLYKNATLDAIACNINGLHSINRRYGRQFGDLVLRTLGMSIRKLARKIGGMGCRQTGDAFLLYCPHQEDYERLVQDLLLDVFANEEIAGEASMRFGVFVNAQQEPSIEERFVCAKIAADKVREDATAMCGFYELD